MPELRLLEGDRGLERPDTIFPETSLSFPTERELIYSLSPNALLSGKICNSSRACR
jgi:hypothetical protein